MNELVIVLLVFVLVSLSIGIAVGFIVGIRTYSGVYNHFKKEEDDRATRKVSTALSTMRLKDAQRKEVIDKIKAAYGADISKRHEAVIDEEIERVLSAAGREGK